MKVRPRTRIVGGRCTKMPHATVLRYADVERLLARSEWPHDVLRHTFASMHYATQQNESLQMGQMGQMGQSAEEDVLVQHYPGLEITRRRRLLGVALLGLSGAVTNETARHQDAFNVAQRPLMEHPKISNITTLDFMSWQESGGLSLTTKFQRREVWKTPARSYFIDSVLKSIPIPPIFIRLAQSEDRKKVVREVIDGQQRLRALLDFVADSYALSKSTETYGGMRFSQLPLDLNQA